MNGIVTHKNRHSLWMWLFIICGLITAGLFTYILLSEEDLTADDYFVSGFFIVFGAIILIIGLIGIINGHRVFISATENGIEAFSTNFFAGRRISCRYSDIISVRLGTEGSLCIRFYDQVSDFEIADLQNSRELVDYIKSHIRYRKPKADSVALKETVLSCQASRKAAIKKLLFLLVCLVCLLAETIIFIDVRGIHESDQLELTVFILTAVVFALTLIAICTVLPRILKLDAALAHTAEQLVQLLLRSAAPGPGNVITMFLNDKDSADCRYVIYRYPRSESVFFTVEIVNSEFEIEALEESAVYPDFEALPSELRTMEELPVPKAK